MPLPDGTCLYLTAHASVVEPGSGEPALAPGGRNSLEALPARPSLRAVWQRESARVNGCRHRGARVFGPPRSGHRATVDEVQSIALRMCGAQSEKTGMGEKRPVPRLSSLCAGQCGRPSRGFSPCRLEIILGMMMMMMFITIFAGD